MSAKRLLVLVLTLTLLFGSALPATAQPAAAQLAAATTGPGSIVQWNRIAQRVAVTVGGAPIGMVHFAYVQLAVYNAVASIDGRYKQYKANLPPRPGASIDAAVATAAYDVLLNYFPGQVAALNDDLAASLAAIPAGPTKADGIAAGHDAAAALINLRQNDGLNANIGFVMPAPAPGVWQLPAGANPVAPWLSKFRPFTLESPSQFRVGPPPALTSNTWMQDFKEVVRMGGVESKSRSAKQTETARFWGVQPFFQSQKTLENIALTRDLDAMEAARLYAMATAIGADALVACWDAKYTYLFWRPFSAVPQAGSDGNPGTTPDATWQALLNTPPHPEYPSAHSCMTGSQAEVFGAFFGSNYISVDIFATVNGQEVVHHFSTVNQLQAELMDARVWAGIHFRTATQQGVVTGQRVAEYALARYFQPVDWVRRP